MPSEQEELRAKLMAEAEAAINRMLEERAKRDKLTITDIERLARSVGQEMMAEISQRLTEEENQPAGTKQCPTCGQKMKDKGVKGRNLITETGDVRVERRYYYCEHCRSGIFPPR